MRVHTVNKRWMRTHKRTQPTATHTHTHTHVVDYAASPLFALPILIFLLSAVVVVATAAAACLVFLSYGPKHLCAVKSVHRLDFSHQKTLNESSRTFVTRLHIWKRNKIQREKNTKRRARNIKCVSATPWFKLLLHDYESSNFIRLNSKLSASNFCWIFLLSKLKTVFVCCRQSIWKRQRITIPLHIWGWKHNWKFIIWVSILTKWRNN